MSPDLAQQAAAFSHSKQRKRVIVRFSNANGVNGSHLAVMLGGAGVKALPSSTVT